MEKIYFLYLFCAFLCPRENVALSVSSLERNGGDDETRTRDLCRDRSSRYFPSGPLLCRNRPSCQQIGPGISGHVHAAWGFARCRMFMRGSYEKGCRSFTTTRISTRPWGRRVWHGARGWSRQRARRVLAKPRSLSFSGSSPSLSRFPPIHSVSQNPIDMLELRCQQRQFGDSFARRTGSATIRGTTAERLSISLRKAGNRRHAICKAGAWPRDVHSLPALSCIT